MTPSQCAWLMIFTVALGFGLGVCCCQSPVFTVVIDAPERMVLELKTPWELEANHVTIITPRPDPGKGK